MSKLIKPDNADLLAFGDPGTRLDTGMKPQEAIARAEAWWQKTGRKEMLSQGKRQAESVGGSNNGNGSKFASLNPEDPNYMPSGLLEGNHWDDLTREEKLHVVKTWHHFYVRVPDKLGGDQNAEFQLHKRDEIK